MIDGPAGDVKATGLAVVSRLSPGERFEAVVHVDAAALGNPDPPGQSVPEDGGRVPAGTSQRPDGRPLPEVPPPAAVPADPVEALRAHHRAQGLRPHARTALPDWSGERLDLARALDVLPPLAASPTRPTGAGVTLDPRRRPLYDSRHGSDRACGAPPSTSRDPLGRAADE
jgi:hypothetical protein